VSSEGRARAPSGVPRGFFLTLEGIEGCGKTTHTRFLADSLRDEGYRVFVTREPGGTPLGEKLRRFILAKDQAPAPEAELFLILAARAQHVHQVIRPRLNEGEVVICDRFADATLAYQGGGRGLDRERVAAATTLSTVGVVPDLTVLFDLPVEDAWDRVHRRRHSGGDYNRFDREGQAFYRAVRAAYLELATGEPERFVVLDSLGSKEAVAGELLRTVTPRIAAHRKGLVLD
jgi:dTMP kinase